MVTFVKSDDPVLSSHYDSKLNKADAEMTQKISVLYSPGLFLGTKKASSGRGLPLLGLSAGASGLLAALHLSVSVPPSWQ